LRLRLRLRLRIKDKRPPPSPPPSLRYGGQRRLRWTQKVTRQKYKIMAEFEAEIQRQKARVNTRRKVHNRKRLRRGEITNKGNKIL